MFMRPKLYRHLCSCLEQNYVALLSQDDSDRDSFLGHHINNTLLQTTGLEWIVIWLPGFITNDEELKEHFLDRLVSESAKISPHTTLQDSLISERTKNANKNANSQIVRSLDILGQKAEASYVVIVLMGLDSIQSDVLKEFLKLLRDYHRQISMFGSPGYKLRFLAVGGSWLWQFCYDRLPELSPFNIATRIFLDEFSEEEIELAIKTSHTHSQLVNSMCNYTGGVPKLVEEALKGSNSLDSYNSLLSKYWLDLPGQARQKLIELVKDENLFPSQCEADEGCPLIVAEVDYAPIDTPWREAFWSGFLKFRNSRLHWRSPIHYRFVRKKAGLSVETQWGEIMSPKLPVFQIRMPEMGKTFLRTDDRKWITLILKTVINPKSKLARQNFLKNAQIPDDVIDAVNFDSALDNVVEDILALSERRGSLSTVELHTLGALLVNLIDGVDYESASKIVVLLFSYSLIKSKEEIAQLSEKFQVPSPLLSSDQSKISNTFNHLPLRLQNLQSGTKLETLYQNGITHYVDPVFLSKGAEKVRAVCRVEFNGRNEGTGFLVAPNLVLTNYHVVMPYEHLNLEDRLNECRLRFGAIRNEIGGVEAGQYVRLSAEKKFLRYSEENKLDYILLQLEKPVSNDKIINYLKPSVHPIKVDKHVNIVHHPLGGPMEVSLRYNQIIAIESERIYYLTDTEKGSSGAPVFDDNWDVVALHRSGGEKGIPQELIYEANAGIPIGLIWAEIEVYLPS